MRVISPTEFQAVTPDSSSKTRFVVVHAVGVTESDLADSYSLERQPTVPFEKLLDAVSQGNRDPEVISSLASRLARLDRQLSPSDRGVLEGAMGGASLHDVIAAMVDAVDPDTASEVVRQATDQEEPPEEAAYIE